MRFEIDRAGNGQYFFRIVARNARKLAHSETYRSKSDASAAVEAIQRLAASAPIRDRTGPLRSSSVIAALMDD
jgi:uncharacterized protein YegP (UPF0339 family)